jgi:hypothetical protein
MILPLDIYMMAVDPTSKEGIIVYFIVLSRFEIVNFHVF